MLKFVNKILDSSKHAERTKEKSGGKKDNVNMTPSMLSRKYEEEQYIKYGISKKKRCDTL